MRGRPQRGFTLIELMLVVAIIGLLSSVAITAFAKFMVRAKRSEREVMMARLRDDMKDYVGRSGACPGTGEWSPGFNPPIVGTMGSRKAWDKTIPAWKEIDFEPDGHVRYHYSVYCKSAPSSTAFYVQAIGDVDGNGVTATKLQWYRMSGDGGWNPDRPLYSANGGAWSTEETEF